MTTWGPAQPSKPYDSRATYAPADIVQPGPYDPTDPKFGYFDPIPAMNKPAPLENLANAPIHPTLMSRQKLTRGSIARYGAARLITNPDGSPPTIGYDRNQGAIIFRFGFNPDRVGIGWQVTNLNPSQATDTPDIGHLTGLATVDFQLLIDRTAEVAEGKMERGVLNDLHVLQRITGDKSSTSQGLLFATPLDFNFGGPRSFRFWGVIQHMAVDMTHYTPDMVPTRAVISMGVSRWADVAGNARGVAHSADGIPFNPNSPVPTNAPRNGR